jgi:hypothetical protein
MLRVTKIGLISIIATVIMIVSLMIPIIDDLVIRLSNSEIKTHIGKENISILAKVSVITFLTGLVSGFYSIFQNKNSKTVSLIVMLLNFPMLYFVITVFSPERIQSINLIDHGVFDTKNIYKPVCVQSTDSIICKLDTEFGIRFKTKGTPIFKPVTFKGVWITPKPGIWDSTSQSYVSEMSYEFINSIGFSSPVLYRFDIEKELLPGPWILQIWKNEHLILEHRFIVVNPGK